MLSMEDEKAIPALKAAASSRLTVNSTTLANAYLNVGEYGDCVTSANTAFAKVA